jgi:type I restriction enzyme S subunit
MSKKKKTIEELLEEALVSEEQPYEIPENWIWGNLNSLSKLIVDGSHNPPPKKDEGFPMLSGRNILNGKINFETDRYVSDDDYQKEYRRTPIEPNDVLLTIVGTIGRTTVVPQEFSPFVLQRSVALVKPMINSNYLSYYFSSPYFQYYLQKNAKGTAQKGVYLKTLKSSSVPLPPLNEQKCIAKKVESLLNKLEEAKQLIEEAKEMFELRRAAILDKAFCGGFSRNIQRVGFKELDGTNYSIPPEWNWISVENVCKLISDCPHSTPKYIENGQYPAIRTSDVKFGRVDTSEAKRVSEEDYLERIKRTQPQKGDVIYCREGTVGNAGIIEDEKVCLAQRVVLLRPNEEKVLPKYFVYVLNSPIMLRQVFSNISQTTSPRINISTLKKLSLPIAPIEIQQSIVNIIEKCFKLEKEANKFYDLEEKLNALKQSILFKAFRGELGTNNPSEENAIELLKEILKSKI